MLTLEGMALPVSPAENDQSTTISEILRQSLNDPLSRTGAVSISGIQEPNNLELQRMETSIQISAIFSQTTNQHGNQPLGPDVPQTEDFQGQKQNEEAVEPETEPIRSNLELLLVELSDPATTCDR